MIEQLNYDIYHLGVSGGKDSTAALLWLRFESGWPINRIKLSFSETDNEDALTYAYLAMLSEVTGLDIEYVYPDCGGFWDLAKKKKRFPSRKARFCTQQLKVIPAMKHMEQLKKSGRVLILSGITEREGRAHNDRGNLNQFSHDDTYGCDKYLPIYDWSLDDIWSIHKRYIPLDYVLALIGDDKELSTLRSPAGAVLADDLAELVRKSEIPCNPLYHMGARRVGCFPCINSAKLEVRAMAYWRPARVDFLRAQEGQTGNENNDMYSTFFARSTVPLYWRTKEIKTKSGEPMMVATIDDVVAWSHTRKYLPRQLEMSFSAFEDAVVICDYRGMCE